VEKGKVIALPQYSLKGKLSLEETFLKRRSIRSFSSKPLEIDHIGQLFWSLQGIVNDEGRRPVPSAGALYPLEVYGALSFGFVHYLPEGHKMELLSLEDLRPDLGRASFHQTWMATAPCIFVIAAAYIRLAIRYGKRAERYAILEAGHAAQNLLLQAVALGLGAVVVGAFDDAQVIKILSLPRDIFPLYLIPVGYPRV